MEIHFAILGPVRVRVAGRLEADRLKPKEREVLGVLLVNLESPMSINSIVDLVWAETPDDKMPGNPGDALEQHRKRINKTLREMDKPAYIHRVGPTYRLGVDREAIDLYAFRSLMERAHDVAALGEHRRARDLIVEALALWNGEPLLELSGDRVNAWRRRIIKDEWAPANDLLLQQMIALGEHARALAHLNDLLARHPDIGLFQRRRLEILYDLGRFQDGLDYYLDVYKGLRANADDEGARSLRIFHDELRTRHVRRLTVGESIPHNAPPFYQVPHDADDFIGRDALLGKLDHFATPDGRPRPGVVVLNGPPGIGKTALAIRWTRRRRDRFPNGAAFINLHGMSDTSIVDSGRVVDELLRAWGVVPEDIPEAGRRIAKLRQVLGVRPTLIVLDNVRDSEHVRDLLPTLSACTVLITSRQRLVQLGAGYGSCRPLTVPRLPSPSASDLLRARLDANAQPDSDIRDLAALCGGVPLAVTLVAHYIQAGPLIPIADYIAELRDPDRILDIGASGDGTDASLRAAFGASYRRLAEPARRVFRLLGLNPAPSIDCHGLAALAGLPIHEARAMAETLAGAHLVEKPASDRYQLHDLLGSYAARLAALPEHETESNKAESRLFDFYLHTVDRAAERAFPLLGRAPMPEIPADLLPREFGNEQEAIAWCVAEFSGLSAIVRQASRRKYHLHTCLITDLISEMFKTYGYHRALLDLHMSALHSAMALKLVEVEGSSYNAIGYCYLELGDYSESMKYLHLAYHIAEQAGSELGMASSLCNLGRAAACDGKLPYAIELFNTAMRHARATGRSNVLAIVMHRLGQVYHQCRQYETAVSYYQEAYLRYQDSDDHRGMGDVLRSHCEAQYELENYHSADAFGRRALAVLASLDFPRCQSVLLLLARVHRKLRNFAEAREYGHQAVELARKIDPRCEAETLHELASLCWESGYPEDARDSWAQAVKIYRDLGDKRWVQVICDRLSQFPETCPIFHAQPVEDSLDRDTQVSRPDNPIV